MKNSLKIVLTLLSILCFCNIEAKVKLPRLISDGMVLQRDTDVKIWGWASPKETITVKFLGQNYKTKADKNGDWDVTLPAQIAGTSAQIEINDLVIKDIIFGDVWLCSGQSNMELPISRTLDLYANEVSNVSNPNIRYFRMPIHYNFNEEETDYKDGSWKEVTPQNIMQFSAVAYFFAKDLQEKYGVPIGLINTAVGGSPAEAWISSNTIKQYRTLQTEVDLLATKGYVEGVQKEEQAKSNEWYSQMNKADKGSGIWSKTDLDVSDWDNYYLPGLWADKGLTINNSVIWLRKEFEVDPEDAGKSATLRLGYIIDADSAFVNGQFVGTTGYQYPPRIYPIAQGLLKAGKNTVTVRVVTNGGGGFKEDKPYKIIVDNKTIDLTGNWKYRIGTEVPPSPASTFFQYKPMGLYNGMISPLGNYKIKGALWYQGESNISRAKKYADLFINLINDWRAQRNEPEMPFIYAQLPELNRPNKYTAESGMAELREAQRKALILPKTGMAITLGLGEWNDIHPVNKKDVGVLLSLEAQRVAYNENMSTSPQVESVSIDGNSLILTFSSVGQGLYSNEVLEGFSIAGSDNKYVWANASIIGHNTIRVWSNEISTPVSVRYAWADNPEGANLKNKDGFKASPFQIVNK